MSSASSTEQHTTLESTEERFRAIFGAHRTTNVSRPEGMRLPGKEDFESAEFSGFITSPHVLYYLEVEDDDAPFLWVTDGGGHSYKNVLYCSSHNAWSEDFARQLALLAPALGLSREEISPATYGFEWVGTSSGTAVRLCFPDVASNYVRILWTEATAWAPIATKQLGYWGTEEFSSYPVRAWEEIMHFLTRGIQ